MAVERVVSSTAVPVRASSCSTISQSVAMFTFRVTVIVAGEPELPDDVTVTCPTYVPSARQLIEADNCSVCGAVPLVGVTVSHGLSLDAVKLRIPLPVFVS